MNWDLLLERYAKYADSSADGFRNALRQETDLTAASELRSLLAAILLHRQEVDDYGSVTSSASFLVFDGLLSESQEALDELAAEADARVKELLRSRLTDVTSMVSAGAVSFGEWEGSNRLVPIAMWLGEEWIQPDSANWTRSAIDFAGRAVSLSIPGRGPHLNEFIDEAESEAVATMYALGSEQPRAPFLWAKAKTPDYQNAVDIGLHFIAGVSEQFPESAVLSSWWSGGTIKDEVRTARACTLPWTIAPDEFMAGFNTPTRLAMDRRAQVYQAQNHSDEGLWRTNIDHWVEFVGGGILLHFKGKWATPSASSRPRTNMFLSSLISALDAASCSLDNDVLPVLRLLLSVSPIGNLSVISSLDGIPVQMDASVLNDVRAARDAILRRDAG
jgi:hypothetical protein